MKDWKEVISSGILEMYVLGETTEQENIFIAQMMLESPEVLKEINQISLTFENVALNNAITPDPIIKPFLLATIDYMDRMQNGEIINFPPVLNKESSIDDYLEWIDRPDMVLASELEDLYAKIISNTYEVLTAIVWIKHMAPQEVHENEYEKFLILEGTCDIHIEEEVYKLVPGDYLSIPLHKKHHVLVTSIIPCKVILQRIAA
jgi:mannose-6-phosphate isomerase-like protein (cupin superfamily)